MITAIALFAVFFCIVAWVKWAKENSVEQRQRDVERYRAELQCLNREIINVLDEIRQAVDYIAALPAAENGREIKKDFYAFTGELEAPDIDVAETVEEGMRQSATARSQLADVRRRLHGEKERVNEAIWEDVARVAMSSVQRHQDILLRKRRQLIFRDEFGKVHCKKWQAYLDAYLIEHAGIEKADEHPVLRKTADDFLDELEKIAADYSVAADEVDVATLSPIEYERLCADRLEACGWSCHLTGASGDQGCDVIAVKDGIRLVVQCKLYSSPVGNSAVQEAIAGREYEGADYAAVVTNSSYTKHAHQLAQTARVILAHHDELPDVDRFIADDVAQRAHRRLSTS